MCPLCVRLWTLHLLLGNLTAITRLQEVTLLPAKIKLENKKVWHTNPPMKCVVFFTYTSFPAWCPGFMLHTYQTHIIVISDVTI